MESRAATIDGGSPSKTKREEFNYDAIRKEIHDRFAREKSNEKSTTDAEQNKRTALLYKTSTADAFTKSPMNLGIFTQRQTDKMRRFIKDQAERGDTGGVDTSATKKNYFVDSTSYKSYFVSSDVTGKFIAIKPYDQQ